MNLYNPENWYWVIADNTSEVFSSASGTLVVTTDATYQAWRAAGNLPSRASGITWTELSDVLQQQAPDAWLRAAATLQASGGLTLAQGATLALAIGLTVTISGSMTLAATVFPVDPTTAAKITDVVATINATGGFPGAVSSFPMKDATGAWHTFETVAQYKAVAAALSAYAAPLNLIIDGNPLNATSLPTASVSLTV